MYAQQNLSAVFQNKKCTSNYLPLCHIKKEIKHHELYLEGEDPSKDDEFDRTGIGISGGGGKGFAMGASIPHFALRELYHCLKHILSIESYTI